MDGGRSVAWDASPEIFNHHLEPPPGLLLDPQFVVGVRIFGAQQLCFDVWAFHSQLSEVAKLARRTPGTTIVLDHLGAPGCRALCRTARGSAGPLPHRVARFRRLQ